MVFFTIRFKRLFILAAAILATILPARGQKMTEEMSIAPRTFSFTANRAPLGEVVGALAKQTGLEIDVSAIDGNPPIQMTFAKMEFWNVVEALAERTDSRVVIGRQGKAVRLVPMNKAARVPAYVDGPFRIAARAVDARMDLQTEKAIYDLTLAVAWEAWLPIYRIDTQPTIINGADDAKRPLSATPIDARSPVSGVNTTMNLRIQGLIRASKQIDSLQGTFRATVADEMLRFTFDDLTKPVSKNRNGVAVELKQFDKQGSYWIADLRLHYPAQNAVFESFEEYWLSRRLTLVAPEGKSKFTSEDVEINGMALRFRFKEENGFKPLNPKGWTMEYETPGVLREVPVRFTLKGITLP